MPVIFINVKCLIIVTIDLILKSSMNINKMRLSLFFRQSYESWLMSIRNNAKNADLSDADQSMDCWLMVNSDMREMQSRRYLYDIQE